MLEMDTLYYIVSLHQTTTLFLELVPLFRCIISFLYIKPQLFSWNLSPCFVVLYRFSTSNHNSFLIILVSCVLYYIVSLHQTTTCEVYLLACLCCIISFLYIKPQQVGLNVSQTAVVLYRFSTSNHNRVVQVKFSSMVVLYRFSTSNHNLILMYLI